MSQIYATPDKGKWSRDNPIEDGSLIEYIQAATSFECDGCGHHASFHSMENEAEEAIVKKWAEQSGMVPVEGSTASQPNKKRKRLMAKPSREVEVFEIADELSDSASTAATSRVSLRQTSNITSRRKL